MTHTLEGVVTGAEIAIGGGEFGIIGEIDVAVVAFFCFVATVVAVIKTTFAVAEFSFAVAGGAVVEAAITTFFACSTSIALFVVVETFAREIAFAAVAETSFFAHASQFVVGFHHIALRAEIVELAFEGDIFAEFAIERSVLEWHFEGGAQTHRVEEFFARGNDPGLSALKFAFELFAQRAVDVGEIFGAQSFAIRRIGDEHCGHFRLFEVADFALFHRDEIGHAGSFGIGQRGFDGTEVDVRTDDAVFESALVAVVFKNGAEQFGVEVFPIFESEFLTEHPGIDIACHERRLHENGTRAAEGVDEIAIKFPTAHFDEGGGEDLIDWRFDGCRAVAAQVETLPTRIERQRAILFRYMNIESQIWIRHTDIGAFSFALHKIVNNGVFHLVSHEFRIAKFGAVDGGVHHKGRIKI